jgi:hypothetical protein
LPMVHTEELLTLLTEHHFPFYLGLGLAFRGRYLTTCGQVQEGLALLAQGLAGYALLEPLRLRHFYLPGSPKPTLSSISPTKNAGALPRLHGLSRPMRSGFLKLSCCGCGVIF